jgi:D-alanyl-D-alanine carboxypeptidase
MRFRRSAFALSAVTAVALAGVPFATANAGTAPSRDAVQQRLDALVRDDGFPAGLASVRQPDGRVRNYTSGVADLRTGAKVPVDGRVRIASNTKMFTAVVVLQLVGEGKISLDAPVAQYLPGKITGNGRESRNITVRQLLQHTSGLPDYDSVIFADGIIPVLHRHFEVQELLDAAFSTTNDTPQGTFSYSNTNYVLAGLIAQKVTGRPISEEITNRILTPVGMRDTYWPGVGDQQIRGAHPRGYHRATPDEAYTDVTELEPSPSWAAGALIGTPSDLNRFMVALVSGRLLKPAQLAEMQTTVPAPDFDASGRNSYGLGLATFTLTCGGAAWTHGGNAPGFSTVNAVTTNGRAATIAVTALPTAIEQVAHMESALDTALCG